MGREESKRSRSVVQEVVLVPGFGVVDGCVASGLPPVSLSRARVGYPDPSVPPNFELGVRMRVHGVLKIVTALAMVAGITATASAQTSRMHLGPRVGYNFDAEALTIGAQLAVPVARHLEFYPSFDFSNVDVGSLYSINLDIKYRVATASADWLYLGTGLGIVNRSVGDYDNADAGLNLFIGAESLKGRVHPFGEARVTIADGSTAMLVGGLNFTL